jgi:hypothetical protein
MTYTPDSEFAGMDSLFIDAVPAALADSVAPVSDIIDITVIATGLTLDVPAAQTTTADT